MKDSEIIIPKLYCIHYNECDPKKCTALKLNKFKFLKIIKKVGEELRRAILLNPFSNQILTYYDREKILNFGLIVIDCSWKKILNLKNLRNENNRKLPSFIAANPINYGKWEKLSSVEALAAALYITDFKKFADELLSKFTWGLEFKRINNL